ncbi:hypothetical protein V2K62_11315 [Pseudomonas alliivorans]|nr:hypothetical protein [Pseudomonas alliivorans]MEE4834962.1 hypothetical protein [Pseudomonas alliivorans]MEE4925280.1 hypothetical protein [Pseudomonas alliivorans]
MLLKDAKAIAVGIVSRIPFLQCLVSFSSDAHKTALKKFFALWILTSLPILFAALWSPVPEGSNWFLFSKFRESISVSEQFVYTASFLTPVLYIWYEKIQGGRNLIKGLFTGYGLVSLAASVVMLLTAAAFGSYKNSPDAFKSTLVYAVLSDYSILVYFFALYCWYLSLIDGLPGGDFVGDTRRSEQAVSSGLATRLKSRGE